MLLSLLSCQPVTIQSTPDTGTPAEVDTTEDTVTVPGEDTAVEEITTTDLVPVFSPDGGGFVGEVTVTLSAPDGGTIRYCIDEPDDACDLEEYTGPLTLTGPAIVHARIDGDGVTGETIARSFFAMDDDVAGFSSDVPVLVFWTEGSGPDDGGDVPMGLDVFDPDGDRVALSEAPVSSGRARLRVRGSSSSGLSKKSYDLELWEADSDDDRRVAMLGMPEDGDWVLYAPYYFDEALVRNALGYALSNDIGRYAPRTRFVEVFIGEQEDTLTLSDYIGVYMISEEIERGESRVDVVEITPDDNSVPEITGGYLIKRDRAGDGEDGFWPGHAGGAFSFGFPMAWVEPSEAERTDAQQDYVSGLLDDLAWALVSDGFTSPDTGLHYGEIIDIDSFIDHHILNVLFKNPDAFRLSGYMHKDREGLLVAGPLWDLDRTAGANDPRCYEATYWDATNLTSDTTDFYTWGWYGGMFADPAFAERYWARFSELLGAELSLESIHGRIDDYAEELEESAARNSDRWGSAAFNGEIDDLKDWMTDRHTWMSGCIETYADPLVCPP